MANSHQDRKGTSGDKSTTLLCPDCERFWNECQCATRKVNLSESLIATASADLDSSDKEKCDESFKGIIVDSRYEVLAVIGKGGMGEVYLAEHLTLKKKIALKILKKNLLSNEQVIERLRREAKACAILNHPNLVDVFDFGITDNGFPYLAMKFIDGISLSEIGNLEAPRIATLMLDICSALNVAHNNGVIHRDLKPTNILVRDPDTEQESAIVVDFGIAKTEAPGGELQHLTQTGEVLGSPAYMSPEQIQGKDIDHRSDIYALGCILFELLTDTQLFRGHTMFAVIEENLNTEPPSINKERDFASQITELERIMRKCLEKDREDRYQSMKDIERDLKELIDKAKKSSGSNSTFLILSCTVIVILIATFYITNQNNEDVDKIAISKTNSATFKELFKGRIYKISEYDLKSEEFYKTFFDKHVSVDIRLAAAAEYIILRKENIDHLDENELKTTVREIREVANQAEQLIQNSLSSNVEFDTNIGATIYFLHNSFLSSLAELKVEKLVKDQSQFAHYGLVVRHACKKNFEIKRTYQDSVNNLNKAIKLAQMEPENNLQLALYYGYLGERLRFLEMKHESITSVERAIKILEDSKDNDVSDHLIWWRCDLGRTYLTYNELENAKKQHSIARKLLEAHPSKESAGFLLEYTNEIKEFQEHRKKLSSVSTFDF